MARDMDEVSTEKLEAHVRARITPEFIEYFRRTCDRPAPSPLDAPTDAAFGYLTGASSQRQAIIEWLERLLSEANNPEGI